MAQKLSSSPRSVLFDGNLIGISRSSMHLPSPLSCKAGKHFFLFGQERGRWRALSRKRRPASPVSTHATPQPHVALFHSFTYCLLFPCWNARKEDLLVCSFTDSKAPNSTPLLIAASCLCAACVQSYPSSSKVLETLTKQLCFQNLPGLATPFLLPFHIQLC